MYVPLTATRIKIDIPDLEMGETIIRRKAWLFNMDYNQNAQTVSLQWVVKHFAKGTDEYLGSIIPDWTKPSVADNNTMCDITNGHPIEKIKVGVDEQGNDITDYDLAVNYTGQYDFFAYAAENHSLMVNNMIRQFGMLLQNWNK